MTRSRVLHAAKKPPLLVRPSRRAQRERAIFQAALEELARSDYGSFRVEQVAARAGVNKTTIYRRWPTKVDLIRAAVLAVADSISPGPSTGSLRADLLAVGQIVMRLLGSFEGQAFMRLRMAGDRELNEIFKSIQAKRRAQLLPLIQAAIDRGELMPDVDPRLVMELIGGAIFGRVFVSSEPVDEVYLARAIDVILDGVSPGRRRR